MTVWVFAGQGTQNEGMGTELFDLFPTECELASEILGYSIIDLCISNPNNRLSFTQYAQPAIFFVNALKSLLKIQGGERPHAICGHSLGEYNALFVANVIDLTTGVALIKARGEAMAKTQNGSMLAVIGDHIEKLENILLEREIQTIDIANFNSPVQIILSGPKDDLQQAMTYLEQKEFKCIPLDVGGPFHSRYMEEARIEFTAELIDIEFRKPEISIFSPSLVSQIEHEFLLETLSFQIVRPVYWLQTIEKMLLEGYQNFIEFSPGENILTKLIQKIQDQKVVRK